MDPVTLLASAIVLGAAAGVKDTAAQVVKDAYASFKRMLGRTGVDIAALERRPQSQTQRAALEETLSEIGAGEDAELLAAARQLVAIVKANAPAAGESVGVDLVQVEAEFIRIQEIRSTGTGFRGRDIKTSGGIDIGVVEASREDPAGP
ncbi:hypothetical protein [Kribbella sp. NBC_00889]|uniref:hypothetical protein n=1 Tax=Kribbella sp. NBC_00889 TaxID=2975974 RepID=UPI00386F56BE|nr:hypothetical protein OG817_44895 [Kribbella sp. NBC_00889]